MVEVANASDAYEGPEWLSWDMLRVYVVASGIHGPIEHPTIVIDWAASGDLDTRAKHLFWNGESRPDSAIPKGAWESVRQHRGQANLSKGRLDFDGFLSGSAKSVNLKAYGIEVRRSQLEKLAPLPPETADNLARMPFLRAERPRSTKPKSSAGRKPDTERWKAFYFAAIELAKDGRLTRDCFASADALNEELLLMMGDAAFNPDHTKQTAGQIFKKFMGG